MSKTSFLIGWCIVALLDSGCSLTIGDMTVVNATTGGADSANAGGSATAGVAGRTSSGNSSAVGGILATSLGTQSGVAGATANTSGAATTAAGSTSAAGMSTSGLGSAGEGSTAIGGLGATGGLSTGGMVAATGGIAIGGLGATGGLSTGGMVAATGGIAPGGAVTGAPTAGGAATGGATMVGCPGTAGPAMVRLPQGYCIDATEVTRHQYDVWLATNPSTSGQISDCNWNTAFAYDAICMAGGAACQGSSCGNHPAVCVDWCDAYAYCKAVGKRLCGKIGGGAVAFSDYANVATDQWYNACSSNATSTYPYGNAYSPTTCNGQERLLGTTAAVSSSPSCASTNTGYGGIFDMSGNVWEWEDSCDGSGAAAHCQLRGGSFYSAAPNMSCSIVYTSINGANYRGHAVDSFGFRCCS